MLVVVHLLHVQVLPGRKVHHMHIEVIVRRLRQELPEKEHLACAHRCVTPVEGAVLCGIVMK